MIDLTTIKLLVYDFDGVMTDNTAFVSENGIEMVRVNRSDGLAVQQLARQGFKQLILSTEANPVVTTRAQKLNIDVLQGQDNKKETLIAYCKEHHIELGQVLYIGNDINDEAVMQIVGMPCCPEDAYPSTKALATYVIPVKGGQGVIRHLLER